MGSSSQRKCETFFTRWDSIASGFYLNLFDQMRIVFSTDWMICMEESKRRLKSKLFCRYFRIRSDHIDYEQVIETLLIIIY
jgi:hypothetical protein